MLSLVMAPLNVNYKILRIKSLGDSNVTESHLANLGFVKDAVVGKYYIVKKINGSGPLKRRIMDMGITKNSEIYIRKVAQLGALCKLILDIMNLALEKQMLK